MRAIPAADKSVLVARYVAEKTGAKFEDGMYQAFAVLNEDDDFVAGVVISNFRAIDCEISCATETSAAWRPEVMRAVFSYIFEQIGCVRCTSITKKSNLKARKFLESLGFVLEGNLRLGYDGQKDALIYGLLGKECRFLAPLNGGLNGQEVRPEGTASAGPGSDGSGAIAGQ